MRTSITAGFLGWMICIVTVGQDINLDGVLDCADTELLGDAIVNGDMDSRFDLDGNGIVELADHKVWQDAVYADRDPLGYEDLNLDNVIDQRDGLIYALNFNVEQPYGHCRGDTNLDGASTRVENDLNYYTTGITLPFDSSPTTVGEIGNPLLAWTEQGVVIAESAAFRLVAVPQVAPDHFMSSKVVVQTNNPDDVVAMIHNLAFTGDAHQVRFPGPFGSPTRSSSDFEPGPLWDEAAVEQLKPLDSSKISQCLGSTNRCTSRSSPRPVTRTPTAFATCPTWNVLRELSAGKTRPNLTWIFRAQLTSATPVSG